MGRIPGKGRLRLHGQGSGGGGGSLALLQPSDFTLTNFYDISKTVSGAPDLTSAFGFTVRMVGGSPRFIAAFGGGTAPDAYEFPLSGLTPGGTLNNITSTDHWLAADLFAGTTSAGGSSQAWASFWSDPDDPTSLWCNGWYINGAGNLTPLSTWHSKRTIGTGSVVSNVKKVSLEGVDGMRTFGGYTRVPDWFQSTYGVGPFLAGWGGGMAYTTGYVAVQCLGFAAVALPDIVGYGFEAEVPATDFNVLADHTSGSVTNDWWNHGGSPTAPTSFDRGYRLKGYHKNFFDGGNANNPSHSGGGFIDTISGGTRCRWSRDLTMTDTQGLAWHQGSTNPTPTVVNSFVSGGFLRIQLGADAEATDVYYTPHSSGSFCYITGGTGAGQWFQITGYNATTKVLTCKETSAATALDATSTIDIGWFFDPSWFDLFDMAFWTGADFLQGGVTVTVKNPAHIYTDALGLVYEEVYIASRDNAYYLTFDDPMVAGDMLGKLIQEPQAIPGVDWDDRQNWMHVGPTDTGAPGDGNGRWQWGDSYWSTGNWIHGDTKHGVIAILDAATGKGYFSNGTRLLTEGKHAELHIFDPVHLGECALGTRQPWDVQPTAMARLDDISDDIFAALPGLLTYPIVKRGDAPKKSANGASYVPSTKTLYVFVPEVPNNSTLRVYEYAVNC